jgi:hypothetical protein
MNQDELLYQIEALVREHREGGGAYNRFLLTRYEWQWAQILSKERPDFANQVEILLQLPLEQVLEPDL